MSLDRQPDSCYGIANHIRDLDRSLSLVNPAMYWLQVATGYQPLYEDQALWNIISPLCFLFLPDDARAVVFIVFMMLMRKSINGPERAVQAMNILLQMMPICILSCIFSVAESPLGRHWEGLLIAQIEPVSKGLTFIPAWVRRLLRLNHSKDPCGNGSIRLLFDLFLLALHLIWSLWNKFLIPLEDDDFLDDDLVDGLADVLDDDQDVNPDE